MGGAFSCGEDNDDLVNILILLGYIRSKNVERVFRAVDRGNYVFPSQRDQAYKDLSWKVGNIHLSAPCVYCKVMEGLTLKPGLSFLNIGSGTGYLNTMAGLILGKRGTNHGIELHEDCLMYAYEHLEIFKQKFLDVDSFEFGEPVFQLGNILNATPNRRYDRVYCGAACPEFHERYVKQFVKVGGILVMPYNDNLLRIERLDENTWRNNTMLPVSFASLVTPPEGKETLQLPLWQPYTLQELCRTSIRCHLRKLVWSEHKDLEHKAPIKAQPIERTVPQLLFGIPFFEEPNRGQSDSDSSVYDDDGILDRTSTFFHIEARGGGIATPTMRVVRAVVQPNEESENRDEVQRDAGTSNNSEEFLDVENLLALNPETSTKDNGNLETEMQEDLFEPGNQAPTEDDVLMDAGAVAKEEKLVETKETQDAEMENYESNQTGARITSSTESKLKRKCDAMGSSDESHNSQRYRLFDENYVSGEDRSDKEPTTSSTDPPGSIVFPNDADDDDDDDADKEESLNFSWIEHAFSILKDKFGSETEQNSDSTSETSNSFSEDSGSNEPLGISDNCADMEYAESDSDELNDSLFMRLLTSKMGEESAWNNRDSRGNGSRAFPGDNMYSKNGNSKKSVDFETIEDEDQNTKKSDLSKSSSESSSDEEVNQRTKYRRGLRSGQKRRSEQRSDTSGSNDTYASNCSDSETSNTTSEDSESNEPLGISNNCLDMEHAESDSDELNGSLFMRLLASKMGEESASNNRDSRGNGSRAFPGDNIYSKNGNSKKSVDFETIKDDDEDTKMPDSIESSSDSSSDEEDNERSKYRRSLISGQKRRPEQRSDTSGSNDTYAFDCSDSTISDPDFDFYFIRQRNLKRNTYAHTIHKEQISHFMQRKVGCLPLPLPLRLYVNYNREL